MNPDWLLRGRRDDATPGWSQSTMTHPCRNHPPSPRSNSLSADACCPSDLSSENVPRNPGKAVSPSMRLEGSARKRSPSLHKQKHTLRILLDSRGTFRGAEISPPTTPGSADAAPGATFPASLRPSGLECYPTESHENNLPGSFTPRHKGERIAFPFFRGAPVSAVRAGCCFGLDSRGLGPPPSEAQVSGTPYDVWMR
jgi:hypothetical protein